MGFMTMAVVLILGMVGGSFAASFVNGSPNFSTFGAFITVSAPITAVALALNAWGRYKRRRAAK